jgi:signal peptidase I
MRFIFGRNPRRTLLRLTSLVILSLILFRFILIPIRVSGFSMLPTYRDGKVNFINHQAYRWAKPKRGDVVAFRVPEEGNVVLLKRIVGLPGERIRVREGKVYINGELLAEPYVYPKGRPGGSTRREIKLRDDEYFVMGDNRGISVFREIPQHYIIGKVLF